MLLFLNIYSYFCKMNNTESIYIRRFLFFLLCFIAGFSLQAQVVKKGEKFTEVFVVAKKVVFFKEIPSKANFSAKANYDLMKKWGKENYGKEPFISSIRYDAINQEIIAKSRIELLLPADKEGIREKVMMRYRVNGFVFQDRCVLEITDITYLYQGEKEGKKLPKMLPAEDFITDQAIEQKDAFHELRVNTKKSTLYFLNELANNFEKIFE